ncbi:MAG: GNAT family N-acetyltransferase [Oricola sp.]|nr:GNAT family N-acetyltransferase [Oricola sp.]
MKIERGGEELYDELTALWERSVRASHSFLSEDDIRSLRPAVREQALASLELWIARAENGETIGFIGLNGANVEALFIDPAFFGRRAGTQLLDHARALCGPLIVDVNEDNPKAVGFYEHYGFERTGRSETDSAGRPFPLIHMAMPGAEKD